MGFTGPRVSPCHVAKLFLGSRFPKQVCSPKKGSPIMVFLHQAYLPACHGAQDCGTKASREHP